MSKQPSSPETTRQWVTGMVVMAATMIGLFAFAKVSIWAVIAASGATMLVGLVVSWAVGRRLRERRRG